MTRHRQVWRKHTGLIIPKGWHVHHLDGDHRNNSPENLICVSAWVHWCIHFLQGDPVALNGKFVQGAQEAARRNAEKNFTSKRQAKYAPLGPLAQLAAGTHLSQRPEACSSAAKRCAELGRSGLQRADIRLLGQKASGKAKTREQLSALGKIGGRRSADGPNAFYKTGLLAKAAANSPNSVNRQKLRCCDHNIIGTLPGMKRYHGGCALVRVEGVHA